MTRTKRMNELNDREQQHRREQSARYKKEEERRKKKMYYVCASTQPWVLEESLKHAYVIGDRGYRTIEAAEKALSKESREWTGGGYFDLKVLTSYNKGKTFELVDDFDGTHPLNPATYHGVVYKKMKGVFV